MRVARLKGAQIEAALGDLAELRVCVFRDFPYLYDGDQAYEQHYMRSYRDNPDATLVVAMDGDRVIGAATGMPLADHADAAQLTGPVPPVEQIYYCAESVLLPAYRGRGLGHAFFDHREAAARAQGYAYALFCGVIRPDNHPARPAGYRPLDAFWRKRGYEKVDGAIATFHWKDIDQAVETPHQLQVWMRAL